MTIKTFIIDDSAVVRTHLTQMLTGAGIHVLGSAADPLFALNKMATNWPDVIVLDVEMPRMDGISFLRKLMAERPTPVVMCSTLTEKGCETTLQALAAGAVSCVTKPKIGLKDFLTDQSSGLVAAVRSAARANLRAIPAMLAQSVPPRPAPSAMAETTDRLVAIGISTGGVQSIEVVLRQLDGTCPGIVMVQHMPESFTAAFAKRLNSIMEMEVLEARDGDRVINGRVLIAPGGKHMQVRRSGAQYLVEVKPGPLINHHRPSVDVLFRSVAQCVGRNAIGIVMTGMGDDGARGLLEMRSAGAITAAQDEATSVVYGMPAEALRLGGARDVVPLGGIAGWIRSASSEPLAGGSTPTR